MEVGTVRIKNTKNILVKNMLDACIGALSFWIIGYALAFGDTASGVIGIHIYISFCVLTLRCMKDNCKDHKLQNVI